MRIGIDGGTWGNARGYGRFTRQLVRALVELAQPHAYTLFLDPFAPRDDIPPGLQVITVPTREAPSSAASVDGYRSPRDLWAFSRALAAAPLDLIYFPSVYTFVPILRRRSVVVCIMDTIAERFPQYVFKNARARLFWNIKTRLAVRQATRVVTLSEHARRGVQEYFHLAPEKIRVSGAAPAAIFQPSADAAAVRAAFSRVGLPPDARVVLYFGGISPHKNLSVLVGAFADLRRDARWADVQLVIAGDYARDVFYSAYPALRAQVEATCRDAVIFTGYVDDATAALLLNGAQVCVLPSLDEGFGLPGVEAAACGTPLIATRSSALPEVLGDAALYFNPTQPAELRAALARVLQDPALRETMRARGLERARQLTWRGVAQRVVQVFEELAPHP